MGAFAHGVGAGDEHTEIAYELWALLREAAFVPDFRPVPDDDLSKIFAMGPEEIMYDIIEPILDKFDINVDGVDFTDFDFSSITTPREIIDFIVRITAI